MTQFRRIWRVTVGELQIPAPMRVSFEVERTTRPQPGKATVKLYNLTRAHQAQIEGASLAQVIVEAGYVEHRGAELLFSGELFRARGRNAGAGIRTESEGVDAITYIEARDGGTAYRGARVSQSFGPGASVSTVLRACASALGVGAGNVDEVADLAELTAGGDTYPEGTVLAGPAAHELTRLLAGLGLRWSVQHGVLQILRRGVGVGTAVRLSADTGLVGYPDVGTRGRVKVVSLLNSALSPGRTVLLEGERTRGRFRVEATKFAGDSHAPKPWYSECELAPAEAA